MSCLALAVPQVRASGERSAARPAPVLSLQQRLQSPASLAVSQLRFPGASIRSGSVVTRAAATDAAPQAETFTYQAEVGQRVTQQGQRGITAAAAVGGRG